MQLEFFDVVSPCIGVCQSDDKGQCLGCFRTQDERLNWLSSDANQRKKVIKRCQQRKKNKAKPAKIKVFDVIVQDKQPQLLEPSSQSKIDNSSDLYFDDCEL